MHVMVRGLGFSGVLGIRLGLRSNGRMQASTVQAVGLDLVWKCLVRWA